MHPARKGVALRKFLDKGLRYRGILTACVFFGVSQAGFAADSPPPPPPCITQALPNWQRADVYKNVPFKGGEEAKYLLEYGAIHVGYGILNVLAPVKHPITISASTDAKPVQDGRWHMQFHGEAYTGDWYSGIFKGNDVIQAIVQPRTMAVSTFYIRQKEKGALSSLLHVEKWLTFDQQLCKVQERQVLHSKGNREKVETYDLEHGAADVLGAVFRMRTYTFQEGVPVRFLVYSSEKNWWLEATPVAKETVEVPAGKFVCDKLKLQTYIGKDLQQKGAMFLWIARDHPSRPMVKVEADVSFGSVEVRLEKFKPGSP